LPYQVTLAYGGTDLDSPFTIEFVSRDFRMEENPRLLPYAPGAVRRRLLQFSSPTAVMTTRVRIERGEPEGGRPGPVRVSGTTELKNGSAAYEKFPYPFVDMEGLIRFNDEQIEIVR